MNTPTYHNQTSLPSPDSDLPILDKIRDGYKLWHSFLPQIERFSRYTLGSKIDSLFLEIVELTLMAGYAPKTQKILIVQKVSTKFDALKFFLQIAWELKALDNKKYSALIVPLSEVGRQLGGWQKQLLKQTPPE